jgi:hypothetical protein
MRRSHLLCSPSPHDPVQGKVSSGECSMLLLLLLPGAAILLLGQVLSCHLPS